VNEQPSKAPSRQFEAKFGVWFEVMVNLTYRTAAVPAVGDTLLILPASAEVNFPVAAVVHVLPLGDVSIR
jgi:hypothetical protein